ncbi:HTH domain-containing protein [Natronococcus wangiae]|uniref:HTH domain-containing protein n=1 Tax=Natronococcus wangiae TaxID=3068275 RepID=UPI003133B28C
MTKSTTTLRRVRIELFLRTTTSADVIERLRKLVTRARRLKDREMVTEVEVKTWAPVRPALEELSDSGPSVSLTVDAFQAWADREGYALSPAFNRRETGSLLASSISRGNPGAGCVCGRLR